MNEQKENIIVEKSYAFALEAVNLYKTLTQERDFVLSKQVLRSGTAIGTNIHEAIASESKRDFVDKLGIAVKEAEESSHWLNLLKNSNYISLEDFRRLVSSCDEITRIINSIILTTKERYLSN